MHPLHLITIFFVFSGIVFLVASLMEGQRGSRYVPEELQSKWLLLMRFIFFFLGGYVLVLLIMAAGLSISVEPVIGSVFLAGAIFVFLVINLALRSIRRIRESEEEVATLYKDLQRSNAELVHSYDTTIEGWARALELRDKDTEGHTRRVTEMTVQVARRVGLSEEQLVHVYRGAMLHDIGKMGVPDAILLKPEALTGEEWEIMKKHPAYAFELLSPIVYLQPALDIPYCHHEKWDGSGYPRGLKGEQIPLAARIFSLADTWDALRSERLYHSPWPRREVRAHLRTLAGTHFDPKMVAVFLEMDWCGKERSDDEQGSSG
jgi:HD-GYP domain-containing protein (c-di-GMP phosphodiesterase class II)